MAQVVTVFGLSGVGKSWIISRYAAASNVAHVQASQLMRDARAAVVGQPVPSEDLRRGPVLDNQTLLTDAFAKVLSVPFGNGRWNGLFAWDEGCGGQTCRENRS